MHLIALVQPQFGQISAVLSRNAGDQCNFFGFIHLSLPPIIYLGFCHFTVKPHSKRWSKAALDSIPGTHRISMDFTPMASCLGSPLILKSIGAMASGNSNSI